MYAVEDERLMVHPILRRVCRGEAWDHGEELSCGAVVAGGDDAMFVRVDLHVQVWCGVVVSTSCTY